MKSFRSGIIIVILALLLACTAQQVNNIKKAVTEKVPMVLATIAQAFGGPYAGIVKSVFDIAFNMGGGQETPVTYLPEDSQQAGTQQEYETPYAQYPQEATPNTQRQLEVEFDVVKEVYANGSYQANSVLDGDTLTQNDNYKVMLISSAQCYLYIVQLDSTGKMDPIFPSQYSPWGNPVEPSMAYSIPPGNDWFYLDENKGVETIYFIASLSRRADLEQLLNELSMKNKSLVPRKLVSLNKTVVINRGIGGVRPGQNQNVNFQDGSQGQYASTVFSSIQADFVMTRWFYHH